MIADNLARYPSLGGRTVLVTGGASGIGAAIVEAFCEQGARVAFLDRDATAGAALVDRLGIAAPLFIDCDLADIAALRQAIGRAAAALGPIGVLVNNAARDDRHAIDAVTPGMWDGIIANNLRHQFFAAQAVIPGMIAAGKGSIINFGSISWMIMVGDLAAYTASKAAMHGMSRSMAHDLGPHGIRINTLVPGWVMTERQLTRWVGDAENKLIDASQALKGRVYPDDIARMALFLAADDSRMISGQDFIVDGGWAH